MAIAAPGATPTVHYHLAIALRRSGETERAREILKRTLAGGDFPEAEAARQQLAELDRSSLAVGEERLPNWISESR
jgi:hypothetical protein